MERGWEQVENRESMRSHWYRNTKYGETYHPASLWGRLIVLACLVVMFILWVTDIVPYALQPTVIALLVTFMIAGFVLTFVGFFRYYGRNALIFLLVVISVALIMIWCSIP
ncbi:MAG: hypothetical protein ACFFF9_09220 [Candidatus Thorarchaeota archaeon]